VDHHIRGSDAAARFGGDEFIVLAPGISTEQVAALAERIRLAVGETPLEINPGLKLNLTVSIGVASIVPDRNEADLKAVAERLLAQADAALYRAKQSGRNRVEIAPQTPTDPGL
jgi:diguanylate cyclase (GGDEF)-like protein